MNTLPAPEDRHESFRRLVLGIAGLLTLVWLYILIGGYTGMLPAAAGDGPLAAAFASAVFGLFTLPALLLALFNRLLGVAFALAVFAVVSYGFNPLLHLLRLID